MSEIEQSQKVVEESVEDSVEKPAKKERKPYVMTPARKEAFERCRQKRQEKIKAIQDEKLVKASEVIKEKRAPFGVSGCPRADCHSLPLVVHPAEPEVKKDVVEVKVEPKAKPKKTKKVVVYQSESSESDSDTSVEIEVVRKKKSKAVNDNPRGTVEDSHNNALNTLISWV